MSEKEEKNNKIGSSQFYNLITGEEVSWQAIIYDLIKTEQLDPWDIDIGVLAERYSQVIQNMEEANFYISSKVLLACSILLRLKSEILSNRFLQEIDESLYGKQDDKKYLLERIELDEDELPILVPRTPMARHKKVTLKELLSALNKAIETENRRIRKDIKTRQAAKLTETVLPKNTRVPLKDRIAFVFQKLKLKITKPEEHHMTFHELAPNREDKISFFLPVLQLANHNKVYLRQEEHFNEIEMRLKQIQKEIDEIRKDLELADSHLSEEDLQEVDEEMDLEE